jgi:hypothetical protein
MVGGAAPFLIVAMLAIHRSQAGPGYEDSAPDGDVLPPPDARDPWPTVLRGILAAAVVAVVASLFGWCRALGILGQLERGACLGLWAVGMAAVAVGMAGSRRRDWTRVDSVMGLGPVFVTAGVAMAAALAGAAAASPTIGPGSPGGPWFWLVAFFCVSASAGAGGYAVAAAAGAVLGRMGNRPTVGSSLLSLISLSLSVLVYLFLWPVLAALGTYACLAAGALTVLALGGVLIINEPAAAQRPRTRRVVFVFGIVIAMTVALPRPARWWLWTRSGDRSRLLESQWLTVSQWRGENGGVLSEPPPRDRVPEAPYARVAVEVPLLWMGAVPLDKHVAGLIGASSRLMQEIGLHLPPEALYPFDPSVGDLAASDGNASRRANRLSATRVLRLKRDWDLVVIDLNTLSGPIRQRLLDTGVLARARNALSPDGMVVVLAPLRAVPPEELDRWVRRADVVSGRRAAWICLNGPRETVLALAFGGDGQWQDRWARWSPHPLRPMSELP